MIRKSVIALIVVVGALMLGSCASTARFKSIPITKDMEPQMLTGKLMKPRGNGPFPAVVILHGCEGLNDFYTIWAIRLRSWGYVTLQVDSFGPRGEYNLCAPGRLNLITPSQRALDAYGAKSYLAELPFVDPNRIAVMGWSHGGGATLETVWDKSWLVNPGDPFRAGVAFYPYCYPLIVNAPLLILIGEKDDWTPAARCKAFFMIPTKETEHEIILKVYPGAYHCFDRPFDVQVHLGHWVGHNWKAASDADVQVRSFLERHIQ